MSDKERIAQIEEFIKKHGHTLLHHSDIMFLITLAKRATQT